MKKQKRSIGSFKRDLRHVLHFFQDRRTARALPNVQDITEASFSDSSKYTYVQSTVISVDPGSSGVGYSVAIFGNTQVTSISGTITIYKGTTAIYSTPASSTKRYLDKSDTIPTLGSGTYTVKFVGTFYATGGSEPLEIEHTDSH